MKPDTDAKSTQARRTSFVANDKEARPLRVLVSGVGRSGTTFAYKQIARQLLNAYGDVNFRYEPYLWNIRGAIDELNPFDMSQLHYFGLQAHTETPLFLSGKHDLHDRFIDTLFNAASDTDPANVPSAYLTKVIRGGGRLRAYLKRYPDLRIVVCLRNPVDTINSSLGMFSVFGEEFHADDRHRFRAELKARDVDVSALDAPRLGVEWYAAWWRSLTEEALNVAAEYPENVFLFRHEAFLHYPQATINQMMSFAGVQYSGGLDGLNDTIGPIVQARSLTSHDLGVIDRDLDDYIVKVLAPHIGARASMKQRDKILTSYIGTAFTLPIAGADLGRRNPIQLRNLILRGKCSPFLSLFRSAEHPVLIRDLIAKHYGGDATKLQKHINDVRTIKQGTTFGAVITCSSDADTIVSAVLSCLNQTLPFDEIVVVDRNSSDGSILLIRELTQRYSSITLIESGDESFALSRDLGFRSLTTEFCTHLDGGDLYWPTKNAEDAAVISKENAQVVFSDSLKVEPGTTVIESTAEYAGKNSAAVCLALLARTRNMPRDMTIARDLYFEIGGVGAVSGSFPDWMFAMKLAASGATWSRAKGPIGTVRNRLEAKKGEEKLDVDAVSAAKIILELIGKSMATPSALLQAYSVAFGPFGSADIMSLCRKALETEINGNADSKRVFATLVAEHNEFAKTDGTKDFATELASFAAGLPKL